MSIIYNKSNSQHDVYKILKILLFGKPNWPSLGVKKASLASRNIVFLKFYIRRVDCLIYCILVY